MLHWSISGDIKPQIFTLYRFLVVDVPTYLATVTPHQYVVFAVVVVLAGPAVLLQSGIWCGVALECVPAGLSAWEHAPGLARPGSFDGRWYLHHS